ARRSRALPAGFPPPALAAMVISLMILVQAAPRRASVTAFLRLICFHLLWPAMGPPNSGKSSVPLCFRAMRTTLIPALLLGISLAACTNDSGGRAEASPRGRALVIRDIPTLPGAVSVDTTGTPEIERATWRIGLPFSAVSDYYKRELPKRGYTILNVR